MTVGHSFIAETFGVSALPRVSWQIDSFGASSYTAALFAEACFDAHVIDRIPWETIEEYTDDRRLEFVWRRKSDLAWE